MEHLLPDRDYVVFMPPGEVDLYELRGALEQNGARVSGFVLLDGSSLVQFVDVTGRPEGAIDGEDQLPDFPPVPRSFGRG